MAMSIEGVRPALLSAHQSYLAKLREIRNGLAEE
jgi:hypothetical protein